jgi:outer membrane lipoprotein SlyB
LTLAQVKVHGIEGSRVRDTVTLRRLTVVARSGVVLSAAVLQMACQSISSQGPVQAPAEAAARKDVPPPHESLDPPSRLPWREAEFETTLLERDRSTVLGDPAAFSSGSAASLERQDVGVRAEPSASPWEFSQRQPAPVGHGSAEHARETMRHSSGNALPGIVIGGVVGHRLGGGYGRVGPVIAGSVVGAAIAIHPTPTPCPPSPGSLIGFGALIGAVAGNVLSGPGNRTMNTWFGATAGSWLGQIAERGCVSP